MHSIIFYMHRGKIRLTNCLCGSVWFHALYLLYIRWCNIRLTRRFCGIAQSRVFSCVLSALRQYQTTESFLWDRPNDSVHAFYCLLHALGQYRTNEVLLWDRPDLYLNVLSDHQGNSDRCLGGRAVNASIVFQSVLFQRVVRADPILMSLHVLLARRPARRLRVCLGCYSQSAS